MSENWDFALFDCCETPFISCVSCILCPCQVARQRATILRDLFGFGLQQARELDLKGDRPGGLFMSSSPDHNSSNNGNEHEHHHHQVDGNQQLYQSPQPQQQQSRKKDKKQHKSSSIDPEASVE
eukprot:gene2345-2893_t